MGRKKAKRTKRAIRDLGASARKARRVKGGGTMLEYLRTSATPSLTSGLGTTTLKSSLMEEEG